MRTVSYRLVDLNNATLNLGFVGENEHTRVIFDSKKMFDQYPDAVASLTVKPPVGDPYPAVTVRDGDLVIWDVADTDLATQGMGEVQLAFTEDGKVAKSYKAKTRISGSVMPTGEIPSPVDDWLTRANAALAEIPQTIDGALEQAKESGEFKGDPGEDGYTPVKGVDYFDGKDGQDGSDGYSPSASVSKSGNTATISVTDKNGTTTATVSDGADGQDGQDGVDGISPTIAITDITGGHRITITDATGAHSFDVMDGSSATAPVQDVRVNGTSILDNGVANIPVASGDDLGVVKVGSGLSIGNDNKIKTQSASDSYIKSGSDANRVISPYNQHISAFYGIAKVAGVDLANESVTLGQFPNNAKVAIAQMLGIGQLYSPMEEIANVVISQDSAEVNVTTDKYGNPFKLAHAQITLIFGTEKSTTNDYISAACFDSQGLKRGMATIRLINGSKCWMVHNFVSFGGLGFCLGKSTSSGNTQQPQLATFNDSDSTYGMSVKNMPYITGVQFKQYGESTTPIIAGSRVVIYGCRVIE